MKNAALKTRIYLLSAAGLTLIAAVLRTLALCGALDADIGYFRTDAALPIFLRALEIAAVAGFAAFPLVVKNGQLAQDNKPLSPVSLCGAMLSAVLLPVCGVWAVIGALQSGKYKAVAAAALLFLLAGAAYFALRILDRAPATAALCSFAVIFGVLLLILLTYFDLYTPMNAPRKTGLHAAQLSLMLFVLYEARALLGRALPRVQAVFGMVAFFLTVTVGVSDLIATAAGVFDLGLYTACDVTLIGAAVYIGGRTASLLLGTAPESESEI